jgi:hypothetical protein
VGLEGLAIHVMFPLVELNERKVGPKPLASLRQLPAPTRWRVLWAAPFDQTGPWRAGRASRDRGVAGES